MGFHSHVSVGDGRVEGIKAHFILSPPTQMYLEGTVPLGLLWLSSVPPSGSHLTLFLLQRVKKDVDRGTQHSDMFLMKHEEGGEGTELATETGCLAVGRGQQGSTCSPLADVGLAGSPPPSAQSWGTARVPCLWLCP